MFTPTMRRKATATKAQKAKDAIRRRYLISNTFARQLQEGDDARSKDFPESACPYELNTDSADAWILAYNERIW
jgi:hypothetical protein